MVKHCVGTLSVAQIFLFFLIFFSSICWVSAVDTLSVEGRVYCDACAAGHFASSSFFLSGAKVAVQCGSSQHVTAYSEGMTDGQGKFVIPVEGEHEKETCLALLLHSPHPSCNILTSRAFASVYLTRNAGLANNVINTGPFSFQPSRVSSSCAQELASEAILGD